MARYVRATLRVLVLVAVAIGVFGMHTVGHASMSAHGGISEPSAVTSHGASPDGDVVMASEQALLPGAPGFVGAGGLMLDPTIMCLAVLSAAGLLVLLRLAFRRRAGRRAATPGQLSRVGAGSCRAPPSVPVGLAVARVSVLRV